MTEPYPPPTPEERQLRAQRLAASGAPVGGPALPPTAGLREAGGLRGETAGVPNYVWLIGVVLVGVVGIIWWRSRNQSTSGSGSTITAANPNSPVDASTAGLATDQYESILALLNQIQGEQSQPLPGNPPTMVGGPILGTGAGTMTPFQQASAGNTATQAPGSPTMVQGPATPTPTPTAPPTPTQAPAPSAPVTQPTTYTVRSGDTLSGIASRFGTTWQNLYSMNRNTINNAAAAHGITSQQYNWIYSGERLVVP